MTIIVFLIDTSASMFQRTYIGGRNTILDVAKSAVETFVKIRQRNMDSRNDRYMLLTFEEYPNNIKAGWKENLATFMNELKNLQSCSMTTMGMAVKQAFDILNINRMTSGIDTYGQGRCPFFLETAIIVLITDGGKLTNATGVHEDFSLPMHLPIPGCELTREPFRWDQRLFALVLRLSGTPAIDRDIGLVPSDNNPIDMMCDVTGGRSYCITSHRMLNQCIDSLVQKVQNGVVIHFEKVGPDPPPPIFDKNEDGKDEGGMTKEEWLETMQNPPNTSWRNCRKMIYVPKPMPKTFFMGFWPIPESFWPELTTSVLPGRLAHPNVRFTCTSQEPLVIENLPFDKYELEPSPLTQYILSRKQPKTCWQVFVANSYKNSEVGHPFGYLKASTNLTCVNLFVMPYNYPVLLPLLDELSKIHRWKPTQEWRNQFQNYMRTLPAYYAAPLRKALTRMGTPMQLAQTLIPENTEALSYTVSNYLKRIKNHAKSEYDKMCNDVAQRQNNANNHKNNYNVPEKVQVKVVLKKDLISHPLIADKFTAQRDQLLPQGSPINLSISVLDKKRQSISFKNSFEIPRNRLVYQVVRMRNNFLQPDWISHDLDSAHSLPISQMGNYQEHLKRQTPQLREIESTPVRQHMFGNPFKIDKRMMVDEADIDLVGSPGTNRNNKRPISSIDTNNRASKRKPGPLPKQFKFRRPSETLSSAPSTPERCPSPSPWLNSIERDIPSFDEPPKIIENGLDCPLSPSSSERSRSPSPPLEVPNHSVPSASENHVLSRTNPVQYNCSPIIDVNTNSSNSLTYSNSSLPNYNSDDKISQILKEVNSLPSVALNHNNHEPPVSEQKILVQSEEEMEDIKAQNFQIRKALNKLVRRPGKNFSELFDTIRTLKGNVDIQVSVVKLIIKESLRFKRQYLASLLEDHINTLKGIENKQ